MSKTKAYTKIINPVGSDNQDESKLIHQSSPTWVLTFVTWDVRDTLRAVGSGGINTTLLQVRDPIVVENDCIQVSTNVNKSVLTHSMSATLVETDINYSTAIAPGDFVFVNMLNWEKDARRIAINAKKGNKINGVNDGFKGVFKVQGVRKLVNVIDPETGKKQVLIKINGFAFTEFNNTIYFNPYILNSNAGSDKDKLLFSSNLLHDYSQLVNPQTNPACQDIIQGLIKLFIGRGVTDQGVRDIYGIPVTANTHFHIPAQIGLFLGVKGAEAAKDVYNYLFGIQEYSSSQHQNLAKGMNPDVSIPTDRFYLTGKKCQGQTLFDAEYWNQIKAWSIICQYINAPLNELYTCFRISPEGNVMPTIVYRQTPFTSELFGQDSFESNSKVTRFLSLPRWKINPTLILSSDLGRDESARINFVQIYAQPPDITKKVSYLSAQTQARNFVYDINDVSRSGLRPSVTTTAFQDLTITQSDLVAREWALIAGDAMIGGHLKFNGTLECVGLVDPIAVGDNLEYDRTVYHIEEVMHSCNIVPQTGKKTFRTVLKLSCGVSVSDSRSGLAYPEMIHTSGYQDRKDNYNNGNQVLPGISEEQDVIYRPNSVAPTKKEIESKNKPFAQPGQIIKPIKDSDDEDSNG